MPKIHSFISSILAASLLVAPLVAVNTVAFAAVLEFPGFSGHCSDSADAPLQIAQG